MIAALALALAPTAVQTDDGPEPEPVLAERVKVAGMEAVMSVSTVVYEGYPDRPHELLAIYVFPDRGLWRRSLMGPSSHTRQIEYRSGDTCWRMDPAEKTSRRLSAFERDEQTLRMELRRALLLWPDGFAWEARGGAGAVRAELGALGHFEAELDANGRPERMASTDGGGHPREAFFAITWSDESGESDESGRVLPVSARLSVDGETVWRETFNEIATRARFLDHVFIPPDRRGDLPIEIRTGLAPLDYEVPARSVLRAPLDPGLDWRGALERAVDFRRQAQRTLAAGRALAPGVEIELSPGGRPLAVLLALAQVGAPDTETPRGWTAAAAERVLAVNLEQLPAREAGGLGALLESLRREVPRSRRTGTPRVWLEPESPESERQLRVLLPVGP